MVRGVVSFSNILAPITPSHHYYLLTMSQIEKMEEKARILNDSLRAYSEIGNKEKAIKVSIDLYKTNEAIDRLKNE